MGEAVDETRKKLSMVKKALLQEREDHKKTQLRLQEVERSLAAAESDLQEAVTFRQRRHMQQLEAAVRNLKSTGGKDSLQEPVATDLSRKLELLQTEHLMACKSNMQLSDKNARLEEDLESVRADLKARKSEVELKDLALKGK